MSSVSAQRESRRRDSGIRIALIIVLLAAYPLAAWWTADYGGDAGYALLWAGAVPQVFCYVGLLWLFGRTLLPGGRLALVTRLARFVHGDLPPAIERYTRAVTMFWCAFFAAMALASVILLVAVSVESWLFFANVLNLPLLSAAFVAEYAVRLWRFPDFAHLSLSGTIRAFRRFRAAFRDG